MRRIAFAHNLRRLLAERSLSLTKVSLATGVPISTLSEWAAGREPKVSEPLLRLSEFLGVSLDELIVAGERVEAGLVYRTEFAAHVQLNGCRYLVRFERVG